MRTMGDECFIKVSRDRLPDAIKKAFELSQPQGLGFLHHREGPLEEETVQEIIARGHSRLLADMDYVHGRSCKFHVRKADEDGFMLIEPRWYDHGDYELDALLRDLGVENPTAARKAAITAQEAFYAERDKEEAE
jgi:hypothetical protein